ncbi:MAG: hypothetical protein HPY66_3637 [Firmicutes bacterium]|nr:hypothetical protein [Bacillota bacterium]
MDTYKRLFCERIKRLRQQYNLGNYCRRSIFVAIEKIGTDR